MAVRNTFNLLRTTYDKEVLDIKSPQKLITFDTEKLKLFHSIIFANVASFSGCFRTSSASTKLPDESNYSYPHHQLIPSALQTLGHVSYKLLDAFLEEEIGSNETHTIEFCFALAAFVRFHFVSIHPFEDGNGRICRYLSKRILDWVCPFLFQCFTTEMIIWTL